MAESTRWLIAAQAAAYLRETYGPSRGEACTRRETICRFMTKGDPATGIKLRSKVGPGGRRYTCVEWIEAFYAERAAAKERARAAALDALPEAPRHRQRRYAKAAAANKAAGIR